MSNARTGLWSAIGALAGAVAGAAAGKYAVETRPRYSYATEQRRRPGASEVEDAMVVGGATGAVLGAFFAGTAAGEDPPPTPPPQLPGR